MYAIVASRLYKKSLKRLVRNKDFKIKKLELTIDQIAHGEILDKKFRDHELAGDMQDFRECHIQSDILLVYKINQSELVLVLVNIGSHSQLFG